MNFMEIALYKCIIIIIINILTNQVWKLLIALFKVPNTGALTVPHRLKLCDCAT